MFVVNFKTFFDLRKGKNNKIIGEQEDVGEKRVIKKKKGIRDAELAVFSLEKLIKSNTVRDDEISGNVLILSDRMMEASELFGNYLEFVTKMKFIGMVDNIKDLDTIHDRVDYLFIYGYLESDNSYDVIGRLRGKNNRLTTIFYANVSRLVKGYAKSNGVKFLFCRQAPLDMLLHMLRLAANRYDTDDDVCGIKVDMDFEKWEWVFSNWYLN